MMYLAAWSDGELHDTEKVEIGKHAEVLGSGPDLLEIAHLEVRKAVFLSALVLQLESIADGSPLVRDILERMKLSKEEANEAIREWRERL